MWDEDSFENYQTAADNVLDEPKFYNVKEGLSKLAKGELFGLAAVALIAIDEIAWMYIGESFSIVANIVSIIAAVIVIASLVLNVQGLNLAKRDVDEFQNLLVFYVVALSCSFLGGLIDGGAGNLLNITSSILRIIYEFKLLKNIADILQTVGKAETTKKVLQFRRFLIFYYVFTLVITIAESIITTFLFANNFSEHIYDVYINVEIVLYFLQLALAIYAAIRTYTTLKEAEKAL